MIGARGGRTVGSKWLKTSIMLSDPRMVSHIPETKLLNQENLRTMLDRHGNVIVKPVHGSGGAGVIKVQKVDQSYKLSFMANQQEFSSFSALMNALNARKLKRSNLIQQGIHLAKIAGKPIDYRVKYVKQGGTWVIRAMVGRVARTGLFVTNLAKGGCQVSSAYGIRHSLSANLVKSKKEEMRSLTVTATKLMENHFPGVSRLGYDYGLDQNGFVWLFEVNTSPH